MLSMNERQAIDPQTTWLTFSQTNQELIWQQVQQQPYSNDLARETAYLNLLCLRTIEEWLLEVGEPVQPVSLDQLPRIWEVVTGSCITVGNTRIVLIPSEAVNLDELRVPQEWVEIPDWVAHYYLACQLNLEEGWLKIVGYTDCNALKRPQNYDVMDRTYSVDCHNLLPDVTTLWVARELSVSWQPATVALSSLSEQQAETLLQQLSQPSPYSPRLEVAFSQWATLLANSTWHHQLYHRRTQPLVRQLINLSRWATEGLTEGWRALSELLNPPPMILAGARDNSIEGFRTVTLGETSLNLVVAGRTRTVPTVEARSEFEIVVSLQSQDGNTPLPVGLSIVVDDPGHTFRLEKQVTGSELSVQMPRLIGRHGDQFVVTLSLGEFTSIDEFLI